MLFSVIKKFFFNILSVNDILSILHNYNFYFVAEDLFGVSSCEACINIF